MILLIFRFKGLITLLNINSFDRASPATFAASAAMAIVWCIAQTENIIPISGTRSAKQLEECLEGAQINPTEGMKTEIDRLLPSAGGTGIDTLRSNEP